MKYITVDDIKRHLYISFFDDDLILADMIDVAEDVVEKYLNTTYDELEDEDGNIPDSIIHAIKVMVGNLYNNRESVSFNAVPYRVPYSYEYLLQPYRNYKRKAGGI